ncbi:MAG: NAD(P)-dependent oxidoreductase [Thermodesulfobacteriota bacterium]
MIKNFFRNKLGIVIGGSGLVGGGSINFFEKKWGCRILAPNSKKLSLRHADDIQAFFQRYHPDFIINTAIAAIDSDPKVTFEINYLGNINLAKVAATFKIPYIFFSSAAVLPDGNNLNEESMLPLSVGLSSYVKSKVMSELTLQHLHKTEGLDYTIIRLAIAYGKYDHKIQGFHRLLFSIADESMPILFTGKNICHSYSNTKKTQYFLRHVLENRDEFSGQTYHFVDQKPVSLSKLILTIRAFLGVQTPREFYMPFPAARFGIKTLEKIVKGLHRFGIEARMPPELMFLENFYKTHTLSSVKLQESSFVDPAPDETVFSRLPEIIEYYLTRWQHFNLISFDDEFFDPQKIAEDFLNSPETLLDEIHQHRCKPFREFQLRQNIKRDNDISSSPY